jgi:CheY-like chemotaxis protein
MLLVNDNETDRITLKENLTQWGCIYSEASSEKEAISKLLKSVITSNTFNIALVDLDMSSVDKSTFFKVVKSNEGLADLKIIVLTSEDQNTHTTELTAMGIDKFIRKPLRRGKLLKAIRQCLAK